MTYKIGIRRETKHGERRTPLIPAAVKQLKEEFDIQAYLQPCDTRAFTNEEYIQVGGLIKEDLSDCPIIFGIKEMTLDMFKPDGAYMCFHHVIKGQKDNMPMLKYMIEKGCTMIDYEKVTDEKNRRLIFFGRHAGYAGMVDTLHGFGLRLKEVDGLNTPFLKIKQACNYFDLDEAKKEIAKVADLIKKDGIPERLCPLVFGFLGYGNVSQGAQSILEILPVKEINPKDLAALIKNPNKKECKHTIYKVVFKEEHMVYPKDDSVSFELQDYYDHPEKYEGLFAEKYLEYITVIVNGAYWSAKYPRSITKNELKDLFSGESPPRLRFIGDISCDIEGGIEGNIRISYIERPYYVYDPFKDTATDGVNGKGPAILAIDHLPTEIPRDASDFFSNTLLPFIPNMAKTNFKDSFEKSGLKDEIKRAVILWKGKLTPPFEYIGEFLRK
ncbi:MAG TPA: bifunctional lysine ketoglutarate reductase /saccharopine dehydrogenase family protein [Candidatus Bathyarchaeia archaeon]|nr:bifunctional lysine ketoglutarate reductase /saccharopine dehydrogenase family protein [Candidatus Bathyarchaeia archaeon]